MRPILVIGRSGQLATALAAAPDARCIGRPELDFDRPETIGAAIQTVDPRLVVNAAAWTAVDAAESEPDAATRANCTGPSELARCCADAGIPLIHVSTDYVFDGTKGAPYVETDPTNPTGVYGRTKLEGERAVLDRCPQAIVLRTSWVYAATGKNFVRTMLAASRKTSRLRVVADQRGCPTTAADLARAILQIADRLKDGWQPAYGGVFHAAGSGETTWHGLACAVFEEAARHGHPVPEPVAAIATADWPTPAKRPADSRLDCTKLAQTFGIRLPAWRASLARTIDEIFASAPA
jgi:dTDP-4-dehydrorhamnose reductase